MLIIPELGGQIQEYPWDSLASPHIEEPQVNESPYLQKLCRQLLKCKLLAFIGERASKRKTETHRVTDKNRKTERDRDTDTEKDRPRERQKG